MTSIFGTGLKQGSTIKVTPKYRLEESKTWHNFVDAVRRMFGAFHLRALLLIGRVLHTLGYVISAFGVRHPFLLFSSFFLKTFPSFLFLENAIQFISQHITKYFVHEYIK